MGDRKTLRRALLVPALAAVLACPAGAAAAGKSTHYPGQECVKCHVLKPEPGQKAPAAPVPRSGGATGTGAATGSQSVTPPPGGRTPAR